jgi:hypothetical protein
LGFCSGRIGDVKCFDLLLEEFRRNRFTKCESRFRSNIFLSVRRNDLNIFYLKKLLRSGSLREKLSKRKVKHVTAEEVSVFVLFWDGKIGSVNASTSDVFFYRGVSYI